MAWLPFDRRKPRPRSACSGPWPSATACAACVCCHPCVSMAITLRVCPLQPALHPHTTVALLLLTEAGQLHGLRAVERHAAEPNLPRLPLPNGLIPHDRPGVAAAHSGFAGTCGRSACGGAIAGGDAPTLPCFRAARRRGAALVVRTRARPAQRCCLRAMHTTSKVWGKVTRGAPATQAAAGRAGRGYLGATARRLDD